MPRSDKRVLPGVIDETHAYKSVAFTAPGAITMQSEEFTLNKTCALKARRYLDAAAGDATMLTYRSR
jgi:hypothetical protein